MEDELIHQLSAAYALDALSVEERRVYEAHLAVCRRCQEDVAAFAKTASALAYAADPEIPLPALRARVLAAARADRPKVAVRWPSWRWRSPTFALAVAACVAVGFAVWFATSPPFGSPRAALHSLPLHGANGSVVLSRDGEAAVLVVSGLPRTPGGKTYEIWVMHGTAARPAGTFAARAGTVTVHLTRPVSSGSFVGVTVEPAGGSTRPSGGPLFTSATA